MTKQLSINLFLAQKIGLERPEINRKADCVYTLVDRCWREWEPHTDKAQWAEVVLWAVREGITVWVRMGCVMVDHHEDGFLEVNCGDTDESRMAAALDAISLALGWKEGA